jgi:hypothetical protein
MTKEIKEKAEQLFAAYPEQEEFYVSSDSEFFTDKSSANTHKHTLPDKELQIIKRGDMKKAEQKEVK